MSEAIQQLVPELVPNHVAIIMDGNGRWAQEKGLPRTSGHREGLEALRRVTKAANEIGVKVLTVYAFSTENWSRPISEVKFLMALPGLLLNEFLPELIANNVRVQFIGREDQVPFATRQVVQQVIKKTEQNTGLILNIAFNYGGRDEILNATKSIVALANENAITPNQVDERLFENYLFTKELGSYQDVDLLIRSSGELRISNFLLWQLAYAEMYFSKTYWPDWDRDVFFNAILDYQKRDRRFGGLTK